MVAAAITKLLAKDLTNALPALAVERAPAPAPSSGKNSISTSTNTSRSKSKSKSKRRDAAVAKMRPLQAGGRVAVMPACSAATYCPSSCGQNSTDHPLKGTISSQLQTSNSTGAIQFRAAAIKAIEIARSFPGVARDLRGGFHISLNYLCCYTQPQLEMIGKAMSTVKWQPLQVRFRWMVCAGGALIVLADPITQGSMAAMVSQVEWAMRVAEVPPHRFRMEEVPFHASIMDINSSFPADVGLDAINTALNVNGKDGGWWNEAPVTIDTFGLEGTNWTFHATPSA